MNNQNSVNTNVESSNEEEIKNKKNRIKKWAPVLFVGAIGSGLWSWIGSPLSFWFADKFVYVFSKVSSSYIDYLHTNIGKAYYEESSAIIKITLDMIVISIYLSVPLIFIKARRAMLNKKPKRFMKKMIESKKGYITILTVFLIISTSAILVMASSIIKTNYNYSAINYIERSTEILAPYLTEKEILMLRSEFRLIESAEQFYNLDNRLKFLSNLHSINIPEFNSY